MSQAHRLTGCVKNQFSYQAFWRSVSYLYDLYCMPVCPYFLWFRLWRTFVGHVHKSCPLHDTVVCAGQI